MFRFLTGIAVFILALVFSNPLQAGQSTYDHSVPNPVVRSVYFHADWCPSCQVIDPKWAQTKARTRSLPVQHVVLDFTDRVHSWNEAGNVAVDLGIGSTFNAYAGGTGLIVLIAADTGEQIDCITKMHSVDAMTQTLERAVERTRTTSPGSRFTGSVFCPPARPPR